MCLSYEEKFGLLPQYRKPPVVEAAIAIEFAPLLGWSLLNYGTMWEEFRGDYPLYEIQTFVTPTAINPPVVLNFADPPVRCFFKNKEGNQLVQSRSGAFVKNWRALPGNEEYPRYATIRPSFMHDLEIFQAYLSRNGFPPLEIWKCEVTYINHLLQGREWIDTASLSSVFPTIGSVRNSGLFSNPTNMRYSAGYELPDSDGSLQIDVVQGQSMDGKRLIQLSITAAGAPKSSEVADIMQWIDTGHYAVVKSFSDFTSDNVQSKVWERL